MIILPKNKAPRRPYKSEAKGVIGRAVKLPMTCIELRMPDCRFELVRLNIIDIACLRSFLEDDQSDLAIEVISASL